MSANCANCGLTISEIKNQLLLQTKGDDIEKWGEHIYAWVINAEKEIGTFNGLQKVYNEKLENDSPSTKTKLPDGIYQLQDVDFCGNFAYYTGASNHFNTKCGCGCANTNDCSCIKWFVNGCYIQTSRKVDVMYVSYLAVPLDEEGYPYVKETHLKAIISYIKYMMLQARFDEGKVPQGVYQTRYREWIMRRNEARAVDEAPSDAELQTLANIYNSKLPVHYNRSGLYTRDYVIVM